MRLPSKKILVPALLVLALVAYLVLKPGGGNGVDIDVTKLRMDTVKRGELVYTVVASGSLDPLRKYEIKSTASGTIIKMNFETGSFVYAGGLLCELDAADERNNLSKAQAEQTVAKDKLEKAKSDLARQTELFNSKFISAAALEDYKLKVSTANSDFVAANVALENANKRFRDTRVVAPISGTILTKLVELGQIISSGTTSVSGGTTIATMADLSAVFIKAYVDETDISRIREGQIAKITVDAYAETPFSGDVYKIEPVATVEQNVTSFMVTTRLRNPDGRLKPGMNASVEVTVDKLTNALMVPFTAFKTVGTRTYAFVVEKGVVVPKVVKVGKGNATHVELREGIKEGARIVVGGLTQSQSDALIAAASGRRGNRGGMPGGMPGAGGPGGGGGRPH